MYEIKIKAVLNGWVVKVGCQTLAFQSKDEMLNEIGKYFSKPKETERAYRNNAVNKQLLTVSEPEEAMMEEEGNE